MNIKILSYSFAMMAILSSIAVADTTTSPSAYNWTGVYIGGFFGRATGATLTDSFNSDRIRIGAVNPLFNAKGASEYSTSASFIGGGTAGYNWQIGKSSYLVGLEAEYGYLGEVASNNISASSTIGLNYHTQSKTTIGSGYGLVGGRLGYVFNRALLYTKGGVLFTEVNTSHTIMTDPVIFNTASTNSDGIATGYGIGGGVEYAPSFYNNEKVTIKLEYLYLGIATTSNSTTTSSCSTPNCITTVNTAFHTNTAGISTIKVGVNYRF
jgi:outer membrane immunogenic protein